jgi:hypothetical protein
MILLFYFLSSWGIMGRIFYAPLTFSAFFSAVAAGGEPPLVAERLDPIPNILPQPFLNPTNNSLESYSIEARSIVGWDYQGCYTYVLTLLYPPKSTKWCIMVFDEKNTDGYLMQ